MRISTGYYVTDIDKDELKVCPDDGRLLLQWFDEDVTHFSFDLESAKELRSALDSCIDEIEGVR